MTRLYLPQPLASATEIALPEAAARHAVQVLRLRAGDRLTLFDGRGGEYAAELLAVTRRGVTLRVGAHHAVERESNLDLTLAQCVSKGERMDYTVQKAVELGVRRIVPVLSARSVVRLDGERWARKLEHWRGVIAAACEQCGRNRLPELGAVQPLADWLATASGIRLILVPGAADSLSKLPPTHALSLLVGPEGGFADDEIAAARRAGCRAIGLGPRVLRTETAGIAALAAIQTLWGDLG